MKRTSVEMNIALYLLVASIAHAVMGNGALEIQEGDVCVPGKLYKLDCNTCRCTSDNDLVCTKMACLSPAAVLEFKNSWKKKPFEQILKSRNTEIEDRHTINYEALRNNSKTNDSIRQQELAGGYCRPGKIYEKSCEKCFCTAERTLICVTEKKCDQNKFLRSHMENEDILHLEQHKAADHRLPHIGAECEPGKLYKVNCNKCWCSEKRELAACSQKYCHVSARDERNRLTGRHCNKNISRFCVHCDCVRNVTKCYINPNCEQGSVEGSIIKNGSADVDQFALDTEKNNCIPNNTYSMHCNRCHCIDGNLVCTSIKCLTNSQVKVLEDKIAKHGI